MKEITFTEALNLDSSGRRRGHPSKRSAKNMRRVVVGVDGEGMTVGDEHRYVLLAASNGEYVESLDGLTTRQCFDFLLSLKRLPDVPYTFVGFSTGYDVNMMLVDIPLASLMKLKDNEFCYWHEYKIQWRQRRFLRITNRKTKKDVLLYDVFGFFQSSFVITLEDWKITDTTTVDAIASMKEKRGAFKAEQMAEIRAYCFNECDLLVKLMQRLIDATNRAEIPCNKWYGAGALAAAMLQKYGVKKYIGKAPDSLSVPILSAYFGGRTELAEQGFLGPLWGYDINSAYPAIARTLPCLRHTTYRHAKKWKEGNALWHVKWSLPKGSRWSPLPFRIENHSIRHPLNGEGWYWSSEVAAALRFAPKHVHILEGYMLETKCDHRPFAFIDEVYALRRTYKDAGDYAHKALKLALNSLYGKTAQSIGSKKKGPPYQSFVWAGMITAGCRAQILDAIHLNPRAVVSIATDGILSKERLALDVGDGLGQWGEGFNDDSFLLKPGVYRLGKDNTTDVVIRTRGFGRNEVDFDAIETAYRERPSGFYDYETTRFVGLSAALANPDEYKRYWRKWVVQRRRINFMAQERTLGADHLARR